MNSLKILRDTIRLLINESIREGNLDAAWSMSPLATTGSDDEEREFNEELEEFSVDYEEQCGC